MANITDDRNTYYRGQYTSYDLPVAASTKIYAGGVVGLNAAGYAVPASGAGIKLPARAGKTVDNLAGGNGAATVPVIRGEVGLDAGAGITQAAVGTVVYFADDHTVTNVAAGNSPAGLLMEISEGVAWVDLRPAALIAYVDTTAAAIIAELS